MLTAMKQNIADIKSQIVPLYDLVGQWLNP